jgi:RNA polymerase sigma factor (sigma-70 family)
MPASSSHHGLAQLASAARAGCGQALERLLAEVHIHVIRCCRAWLSRIGEDAACETAQEALVRIARGLSTCRAEHDDAFLAWCRAVARHAALDRLRDHRREWEVRAFAEELGDAESDGEDAGHSAAVAALLEVLEEALTAEPDRVHALLWHRVVRRDSWAEVAVALGLTAAGAKRRYQRAAARIRRGAARRLSRKAGVGPAAALVLLEPRQRG